MARKKAQAPARPAPTPRVKEKSMDFKKEYAICRGRPPARYMQDGKYYTLDGEFLEQAGKGSQPLKLRDRRAAAPRQVIAPKNAREEALSKLGSFDTIPAKVRDARAENARAIAAEANADK